MLETENCKEMTVQKLSAGITHEINTPLTYTLSNIELLIEDIDDLDPSTENKEYMLEDAKRVLEGLYRISNVVELLKEVSSQSSEIAEQIDIVENVKNAINCFNSSSQNISQIKFIDNSLKSLVEVQEKRVQTLWKIIINNALDALKTKDDFDARVLKVTITQKDDNFVTISFEDNAGGIAEDILENIFNNFKSKRTDGGMGLGLKVAQLIVKEHKGTINAKNFNDGALFQVTLPLFIP